MSSRQDLFHHPPVDIREAEVTTAIVNSKIDWHYPERTIEIRTRHTVGSEDQGTASSLPIRNTRRPSCSNDKLSDALTSGLHDADSVVVLVADQQAAPLDNCQSAGLVELTLWGGAPVTAVSRFAVSRHHFQSPVRTHGHNTMVSGVRDVDGPHLINRNSLGAA